MLRDVAQPPHHIPLMPPALPAAFTTVGRLREGLRARGWRRPHRSWLLLLLPGQRRQRPGQRGRLFAPGRGQSCRQSPPAVDSLAAAPSSRWTECASDPPRRRGKPLAGRRGHDRSAKGRRRGRSRRSRPRELGPRLSGGWPNVLPDGLRLAVRARAQRIGGGRRPQPPHREALQRARQRHHSLHSRPIRRCPLGDGLSGPPMPSRKVVQRTDACSLGLVRRCWVM